jgi:hypothetical protein
LVQVSWLSDVAVREDLNKGLERGPGTRDLFTGGSYRAKWRGLV